MLASTHPQLKMQHYIPPPKGGSQDDPAAQVRRLRMTLIFALLAGPHSRGCSQHKLRSMCLTQLRLDPCSRQHS